MNAHELPLKLLPFLKLANRSFHMGIKKKTLHCDRFSNPILLNHFGHFVFRAAKLPDLIEEIINIAVKLMQTEKFSHTLTSGRRLCVCVQTRIHRQKIGECSVQREKQR